jgi:hypothetical protein
MAFNVKPCQVAVIRMSVAAYAVSDVFHEGLGGGLVGIEGRAYCKYDRRDTFAMAEY